MRTIFKHFRQVDDIVEMTGQCISVEATKDGAKEQMADSSRLATLVEFMKCYPVLVKRDKNTSQGINYVLRADQPAMVSHLYSPRRTLRSLMGLLERTRISECLATARLPKSTHHLTLECFSRIACEIQQQPDGEGSASRRRRR